MVKQMRERLARDRHTQLVGMYEIRLGHVSRLGRLTEHDVAFGTFQRPPPPYSALQFAADAIVREEHRVQTLKVAQQGDGLQHAVVRKRRSNPTFPLNP
jgi:hypothetical protein